MEWVVSDQGSYFSNELIKGLNASLHLKHHFTTFYSPWANGSVERICQEILRACKAMLHEFRLSALDWPAVTEAIQSTLNHSPLKRLGLRDKDHPGVYRSPLKAFTRLKHRRPLLQALPVSKYQSTNSMSEARANQIIKVQKTQSALENMHKELTLSNEVFRKKSRAKHNRLTTVQAVNLRVGDFVLIRRPQRKGHNLTFVWRGPRRITKAMSEIFFETEDLLTKKIEIVHGRRMVLYRTKLENQPVDPTLLKYIEHGDAQYVIIADIRDIRESQEGIELHAEWYGLPDREDWTWEPLFQIFENVPDIVHNYLSTPNKRKVKQLASKSLSSQTKQIITLFCLILCVGHCDSELES